ncbi:transmembrane amino acid transporter protein-domain-containing protein [Lyophyllum atratum]|nr:transmembrane amino acid transporter protein-domain-containing protein [Lyophyllum atratum]
MPPLCFAYYCSGHGYGHATRVSAFTCHLLSLPAADRPTVYITSSAPKHVFADSIALGARYRYADIDPVIVQPLAYRVDRQKSLDVLKSFLRRKNDILDKERRWLDDIGAHAVLSDAAFLGCLAAKAAGIPSILITNFTFDSVYSYLSTPLLQVDLESPDHLAPTPSDDAFSSLVPDIPVPSAEVDILVNQIFEGYRCADLLFLLPGCIPIPSFSLYPPLPSPRWVDASSNQLHTPIIEFVSRPPSHHPLHASIPFEASHISSAPINSRSVIAAPLLVRPPTSAPSVYSSTGRSRLLSSIGVPGELHDPANTKILIVSFGGQVFRAPSRSVSRTPSRSVTPSLSPTIASSPFNPPGIRLPPPQIYGSEPSSSTPVTPSTSFELRVSPRLGTPSHIWIPGAPPAHKPPPAVPASAFGVPVVATLPPTPDGIKDCFDLFASSQNGCLVGEDELFDPRLLPDESWIAIVCGVSKWEGDDKSTGLPEGFYVAPKDVYMPDLTAVGDVLLGKLGYGTVSECVDSCTPFVYVSRPLFIEEHGLRLLLNREGVGVELSRQSYEAGDWALAVEEAWARGKAGSDSPPVDLDGLPDEEKAKVLRRHLVSRQEREGGPSTESVDGNGSDHHLTVDGTEQGPSSRRPSTSLHPERDDSEPFPIPYNAPGGDVTHDIYKWHAGVSRGRARAASFAGPSPQPDPAFEHIHEPGGFRRNYVILRATEQGTEEPRMLNNFIDFLYIFGHFAGEDLEEEEDKEEDEEESAGTSREVGEGLADITEDTPLLSSSPSRSRSRRRKMSVGPRGTASTTQAVLMLLKSFVGTGVLFLGKAFYNGGLLFSAVTFVVIALISLYSFLLLVKTKFVVSGSFGDIGGTLYGPWMRYLILGSIVVSQIGFVAAYTIFVSQNLQSFVMGITQCLTFIPVQYFILMQLVIFLPLALVRDIAKLGTTALIADAFILAGLIYIFGSEISIVSTRGIADIIPITDSMREPRKFPAVLTGVMIFLTILFGGAGALGYLTFGSDVETVVLVNLNSESSMVQTVQFLYSLAILLSVPLQFFPAVRILENGLFTRSGKVDPQVKWLKNGFRFAMVMVCTAISWLGAADLDKFVAFVGCFACVPLCYVYPAMLHYRACSRTKKQKAADIALIIFGLVAFVYTTVQTVGLMMEPPSGPPKLGSCPPPAT